MNIHTMHRGLGLACALFLTLGTWLYAAEPTAPPAAPAPAPGTVSLKAAIVGADLALKPLAKRPFRIDCAEGDCGVKQALVTNFDGEATSELLPGKYILSNVSSVEFEGKRFDWKLPFEVRAGETARLELSNDNATIGAIAPGSVTTSIGTPPTEGQIFLRVKPSVFKVIAEGGEGSGFLVDAGGLVLTNHHVVAQSDYLAIKIDEKRKVAAVIAAADTTHDLAVLRLNAGIVKGLSPLELTAAAPAGESVMIGERVLAVGSPLATEAILTTGVVSKVDEGVIYSDVNINPGNSGGPLFNMQGNVIGVNTFGLQGQAGPGVAGIVRAQLALPLIEKARATLSTAPAPPDRLLPEAPELRYPSDKLKEIALRSSYDANLYHLEAGKIDVQFITPVVLAELEVQSEKQAAEGRNARTKGAGKQYQAGQDFYDWRRFAGDYRAVVRIQAVPEIAPTAGSFFTAGFTGSFKLKFKTDFDHMELLRDGVVIEPIHPGRFPNVINVQGAVRMSDISYYGAYEYPPEVFRPGGKLMLKIWEQGKPEVKPREVTIELQNQVWIDFQPYFAAMKKTEAEGKKGQ